ncbi:MAG: hypothetical protein ACMG57_01220 [Candidatus Dojkabacteria bacterium]
MSGNTVRNILSIWIFAALVVLGVGLALFINKINAAPEDSKASALAGATIELGIKGRDNVSQPNQLLFNIGDKVSFSVIIPTFPTTGAIHDTLVLKLQYPKANFDVPSDLFVYDSTKYLGLTVATNPNDTTTCKPLSALYECRRIDITKLSKTTFVADEVVAEINLTAKALTTATTPIVVIFPKVVPTGVFPAASYSYVSNDVNQTDPLVFFTSPNANKLIKIEDQCYGDYNRLKGVSGEIVDPSDLSRFAGKYGGTVQLQGADQELDIDNRGASKNYINVSDLSIFASNYGTATCARNKSDGLP